MLTIEAIRSAGAVSSSATQSSQVTRRVGLDRQCAGRSVAVLWTGVVPSRGAGTHQWHGTCAARLVVPSPPATKQPALCLENCT
jgi:hypothetical protein